MVEYTDPERCGTDGLTPAQIDSWRTRGFALIDGLLPRDLLDRALQDALAYFPAPGTAEAENYIGFGSAQRFVFPARSEACNEITLHPRLLQTVATLLDTDMGSIRLTQSDLWPKYGSDSIRGEQDNTDQRIHCDYPNHTLTHPPPWEQPEAVEVIIYLSEFADCEGATAVVPRTGADDPAYAYPIMNTPGVAGLQYVNDRASAEAYLRDVRPGAAEFRQAHLYAREVLARYSFGSILLYRHDTWHRGTPMQADTLRLVHNLTFKKADADWVNVLHAGWSWSMYRPDQFMERLIASITPTQRAVLGFPLPGSPYWNDQTIEAVAQRYGAHGIDMAPYKIG